MNTLDDDNVFNPSPTYDEIIILFDADMNPGTINTTNILVQDVESMTAAQVYSVTYEVRTKRAIIKADWDIDKRYLVTVTARVKDLHGQALDGNGNGYVDPQDYYREQFTGVNSTVPAFDVTPPTVTMMDPTNERIYFSITDSIEIYLADSDTGVLRSSITDTAFVLTNAATGQVVALPAMSVDEAGGPAFYIVRFRGLSTILHDSTDYFLTVKTSIRDRAGNMLDGDGDGKSEAEVIDRERVKFRTYDPRNGGIPAQSNFLVWEIDDSYDANRSMLIKFTRKLNPATVNAVNIKIYNNLNYTGYVPGSISIMPDSTTVRYTLENYDGTGYLWVSRLVKDTAGFYLDQNNNGISGEAAYTTTVANDGAVGTYSPSDDLFADINGYASSRYTIVFYDMVETEYTGWSRTGTAPQMWHRSQVRAAENANYGGTYCWRCGVDGDTSYLDTTSLGVINAVHDTLKMPIINLGLYYDCRLLFDYNYVTDDLNDRLRVIRRYKLADGSWSTWAVENESFYGNSGGWLQHNEGVSSAYSGREIQFGFAFDTNALNNTGEGIYLDNIRLEVW